MENPKRFDEILEKLDRVISYTFGLVAGGVVITGLVVGIGWAWKKSQKAQENHKVVSSSQYKPMKSTRDPFVSAEIIQFRFPYLHGGHPQTINLVNELSQHKSSTLSGGYRVKGVYVSEVAREPVDMTLSCDKLCHLEFQLPARLVLTPSMSKGRLVYPERQFQVESHGVVFHIENSTLHGISRKGTNDIFPFSTSYPVPHKEIYKDATGQMLKVKG